MWLVCTSHKAALDFYLVNSLHQKNKLPRLPRTSKLNIMARTKKDAMKGAVGNAARAKLTQKKQTKQPSKRQRQEEEEPSRQPSPKKPKTIPGSSTLISEIHIDKPVLETTTECILSDPPAPEKSEDAFESNSSTLPPGLEELKVAHEVITISIVSSSNIQQKVTRALDFLSPPPASTSPKPKIIILHSKAKTASKMISIAEIAKREFAQKGETWFQYNHIGQIMQEQIEKKKVQQGAKVDERSRDGNGADGKGGESEDEDADFESMKTPFERAIEGRPKVRAMPTMSIYLSKERINTLRTAYGYVHLNS